MKFQNVKRVIFLQKFLFLYSTVNERLFLKRGIILINVHEINIFQKGFKVEDSKTYKTIPQLIDHLHSSQQPLKETRSTCLKKPVYRKDWQLDIDDVKREKRIGEVIRFLPIFSVVLIQTICIC